MSSFKGNTIASGLTDSLKVRKVLSPSARRTRIYPTYFWYCILVFLAILCVGRITSSLSAWRRRRHAHALNAHDVEHRGAVARRSGWSRIPAAALNAWRVVAFRSDIAFGPYYSINLAEGFVTLMYLAALFTWSFINSALGALVFTHFAHIITARVNGILQFGARTGTISAAQIPLIVALGMRNNIIGCEY